jgi:hypothetical protein
MLRLVLDAPHRLTAALQGIGPPENTTLRRLETDSQPAGIFLDAGVFSDALGMWGDIHWPDLLCHCDSDWNQAP